MRIISQIVPFITILPKLDSLSAERVRQLPDSEAETSGSLTESYILNNVTNKNYTTMDCNEDKEERENDDNVEINKASYDMK
ncbi:hypothetical protein TNCV_5117001 [Trichonephila clavipes]|nr:hypothetical protein TNCV_5117001 [Trichonephila clavipes]